MRICVFGAGAIGSLIGARLAASGVDVSLVARGEHLDAIRERGLVLLEGDQKITARPRATDDPASLGPQDHVIVALKANSVPDAVDAMAPLLAARTTVVTAQNGIPWWFFHAFTGSFEGHRIESVDPGGRVWDQLGPHRAIGCVVYPSCEVIEPGVVRHLDGERLMVGEPDGSVTPRVQEIAAALHAAGFRAPVRRRIRDDVWLKLWGNVSFNPVSALTMATVAEIGAHAPSIAVVRTMMEETAAVARALGARFPVDVETRIEWALGAGEHKTSMLQDLERGRPMEIGALIGAVAELGRLVAVTTPTIDVVLGLLELRERTGYSPPPTLR
jgi:2-dehydropantoate 2-reductase